MVSLVSLGILLVLAATEAAQERLFDVKVNFTEQNSSKLLKISFDRKYPFSVLDETEVGKEKSHNCFLQKNGSILEQFVQNGPDNVAPFTVTIVRPYEPCEPIQKLSIRCEIQLFLKNVTAKSKEFDYDKSQGFLNYHCDENVFYALTIGGKQSAFSKSRLTL